MLLNSYVHILVHFWSCSTFNIKSKYFGILWWLLKQHILLSVNVSKVSVRYTSANLFTVLQQKHSTRLVAKLMISILHFDGIGENVSILSYAQVGHKCGFVLKQHQYFDWKDFVQTSCVDCLKIVHFHQTYKCTSASSLPADMLRNSRRDV